MSQAKLAALVGLSPTAVSQIERGVNVPRYENAAAIDAALGAGGAVLEAFGYVNAEGETTASRLAALEAEMEALRLVVKQLGGAVLDTDPIPAAPAKRGGRRRAASAPRPSR